MLNGVLSDVAAALSALGLRVVSDPRNLRPPCVIVQAPSFTVRTDEIREVTVAVQIVAPGPGNLDALLLLLDDADLIAASMNVTDGRPSIVSSGSADYPAYDLTLKVFAKP